MEAPESVEHISEELKERISIFLDRKLGSVALDRVEDNESSFEDAAAYDLLTV